MTEWSQKCPTCRGLGPDTFDIDAETRTIEAECGDVWHDRFVTDKPVSERATVNETKAQIRELHKQIKLWAKDDYSAHFDAYAKELASLAERLADRLEEEERGDENVWDVADEYKKRAEKAEREVDGLKEALEFAAGAIADAIGLEDGLDAAAGEAVLRKIEAVHPEPIARMRAALRGGDRE